MKDKTPEEKLELIDNALKHFYDTDIENLLYEYGIYLESLEKSKTMKARPTDRSAALDYFNTIPERCYNDKPLEMKQEMLMALTEEELLELLGRQVGEHPSIEMEIRSMFEYCLKIKYLLET